MKRLCTGIILVATLLLAGCGSGRSGGSRISVTIVPSTSTVIVNATQPFSATVGGSMNNMVTWGVNGTTGGNATVGTITSAGLYTAPATVPSPATVTIQATSADGGIVGTAMITIDSGISITLSPITVVIGTGEMFTFTGTVTGNANTAVNFSVNDVAGGNATVGTITSAGVYTAPMTTPSPASVTIRAAAAADTTRTATASLTIATAMAPTLTSISPTMVAQGSLFHDLYLTGTNFLSTSTVRLNGITFTPARISATLLRVRLQGVLLDTAGTLAIEVVPQVGMATAPLNMMVLAVRPALVSTSPDAAAQGSPTVTVQYTGGYYGSSTPTAAVGAEFNATPRAATVVGPRQLDVTIGAGDLATAGLFAVGVRSASNPALLAAGNLAVQPAGANAPSVIGTVSTQGIQPSSVAINTSTGIAVVANRGSGSVLRIDPATASAVGTPIAVGTSPTGVAVDSERNLAVVANNGSNNISVVDLAFGMVTATIPSPTLGGAMAPLAPIAAAVNPVTGMAVIANAATNSATIVDLNTNAVIATVPNVSTGANPEVGIDTRLNWALVTPGGAGILSIIDLGKQNSITATGAVRAANTVTITTGQPHTLVVGQIVTLSGVTDPSFNGTFTVPTAPSGTTFTYSQVAADAMSGGGVVVNPAVLATLAITPNVRGVAVSSETSRALLADTTATAANALIFSLLDQSITPANVGTGHTATAVNALTDVGVVVNPAGNSITVVGMRSPVSVGTPLAVGMGPRAAAIDPGANIAVVANETSGDVSIVNLGLIRSPHIVQSSPLMSFTSGTDITLNVTGFGFTAASALRLDGAAVATAFVSPRRLTATVPAAMLGAARRFVIDVLEAGVASNVSDLTVIQSVSVGTAPGAVAIDPDRDLALVANSGSDDLSLVDMNTGLVTATIAVGDNPQGVAVLSRASRAVVTNRGSDNASLVDLAMNTVSSTVTVSDEPLGVAINPDTGTAVVANSNASSVSVFSAETGGTVTPIFTETRPTAVAIDPTRGLAAVTHTAQNSVVLVNITGTALAGRLGNISLPNGIDYDPVTDRFVVASSLSNNLILINPATLGAQQVRVGINPTSLAYNRHSSTLVTTNTASQTMTVMDFANLRVRYVMSMSAAAQFSVAIHPRTNLAVVVDEANNRVLLVPLPK